MAGSTVCAICIMACSVAIITRLLQIGFEGSSITMLQAW